MGFEDDDEDEGRFANDRRTRKPPIIVLVLVLRSLAVAGQKRHTLREHGEPSKHAATPTPEFENEDDYENRAARACQSGAGRFACDPRVTPTRPHADTPTRPMGRQDSGIASGVGGSALDSAFCVTVVYGGRPGSFPTPVR
jgi:hypothetical protein